MDFKYPSLEIYQKNGEENFCLEEKELLFKVIHFWRWLASDLCSNALRGTVAEPIVGQALVSKAVVLTDDDPKQPASLSLFTAFAESARYRLAF